MIWRHCRLVICIMTPRDGAGGRALGRPLIRHDDHVTAVGTLGPLEVPDLERDAGPSVVMYDIRRESSFGLQCRRKNVSR